MIVPVLLVLCIFIKWFIKPKQPPGPWELPILGNLHQLLGKQPHLAITNLSKRYGPLMSLRLGSVRTVVASSPEMAREFLQSHDLVWCSRPNISNAKLLTYGFSGVMWAPYGRPWRELRKICVLELFTTKRVEGFEPVRVHEVFHLVQRIFQESAGVVNLKHRLTEFAWSVVVRMVSNRSEKVDVVKGLEAKTIIDQGLELAGTFNLADYISVFRGWDLQGYSGRTASIHKKLDAFFQALIDEHRQQPLLEGGQEDFIDILGSLKFVSRVNAIFQDIFAAGTDTSSVTTEWAMTELIRHPVVLLKARDELDKLVGRDRLVTEADVPKLEYLQAIIKETLRLHPPGPLLQHESMEACQVQGYHLPAGTRTIINLYGISRDPSVWKDPLVFHPERFLQDPRLDFKGQHFEFIPFGAGRRICPGMSLGLKTVHLVLAQLLHCFDWESLVTPPDLEELCGMTLPKANPLMLVASPRLFLELYES